MRRRAFPSSSGEHLANVRRKGVCQSFLLRGTQRQRRCTHRNCEEEGGCAIPLLPKKSRLTQKSPVDLGGGEPVSPLPGGHTTNNRSTKHRTRCTKPFPNCGLHSGRRNDISPFQGLPGRRELAHLDEIEGPCGTMFQIIPVTSLSSATHSRLFTLDAGSDQLDPFRC